MGFGRLTIDEFTSETHLHPSLPLEGEGALTRPSEKYSIAEFNLGYRKIYTMLFDFDAQKVSSDEL